MKYTFVIRTFGLLLNHLVQKEVSNPNTIKKEYKEILLRAKDIGKHNIFITSYALGAYYLAMCRKTNLSPIENFEILNQGIQNSKIFKLFLGNANSYLSTKQMSKRKSMAKESHKRKYQNDWVWDVIDPDNTYDGGYNYYECGICKMFKEENALDLVSYVCKLDYGMFDMIGITLVRTKTLADQDALCDFRFIIQKNK